MTNQTPESVIAEALSSAGAPLMHSRVEEGVAAALRAATMLREPGVPDAATEELESTIYPDYEGLTAAVFERSHEPAFSDDSGGLREARAFAESLVEMYIDQQGMKQLKAERDAALAAIERVRAEHEPTGYWIGSDPDEAHKRESDGFLCLTCSDGDTEELLENWEFDTSLAGWQSWPCPTVAALDGAPKPEREAEDAMYQAGCGSWDCRAPECGRA